MTEAWSDVVARRAWEVTMAKERLEKMEAVDLPLCRIERVSANERTVRFGLKRGKLLYLFQYPDRDVERDKHRNVIARARFIKTQLEAAGYRLIPWDFKKGQPPRFWNDAAAAAMEEDDDDLYGPAEPHQPAKKEEAKHDDADSSGDEPMEEESADEDDDDDDDSDSDLEIIIDKPATAPKPTQQQQQQQQQPQESKAIKIEAPPQPSTAPSQAARTTAPQVPTQPGTAYPVIKSSTIDVNADPVYPPVGKPISQVSVDADLAEENKPWRLPGADQSDYYNYGFDELQWELYRLKQQTMAENIAEQKSQITQQEQMLNMFLPGAGGAGPPSAPAGFPGMPNEAQMMQTMQQMMSQGIDPSNMDLNQVMMQMNNGGAMGGFGGPAANQGGFSGGHGGGGGGRGRGRGRGNW